MENKGKGTLTQSQFAFLINGCVLGPGFIRLPYAIAQIAKQDAAISSILGLIYPLFIIQISLYIIKKYSKSNILEISRKCYGKIFGTILNCLFYIQFLLTMAIVSSDTTSILLTFVVEYLSPLKVGIVITAVACYAAYMGIKTLGKVNVYITYIILFIFSVSAYAIFEGTLLNLRPVFGVGFKNILSGAVSTSYYYLGFEVILLYHTFVGDFKKIKRGSYIGFGIAAVVWVWTVFICLYNMGPRVVGKVIWPVVNLFASINIPVIANFMYFLMSAWTLMNIKVMSNYFFINAFILSDITKIELKKLTIGLFPFFLWLGILFMNAPLKKIVLGFLSPIFVIYNCVFLIATAIIINFKFKNEKNT